MHPSQLLLPSPYGNGGKTAEFIWTQTFQQVELYVPLVAPCSKKEINVAITGIGLKVVVAGLAIVAAQFQHPVTVEESAWMIEEGEIGDYDGRCIHVVVEKSNAGWWSTPFKGHQQIDITKIKQQEPKLPLYQSPTIDHFLNSSKLNYNSGPEIVEASQTPKP